MKSGPEFGSPEPQLRASSPEAAFLFREAVGYLWEETPRGLIFQGCKEHSCPMACPPLLEALSKLLSKYLAFWFLSGWIFTANAGLHVSSSTHLARGHEKALGMLCCTSGFARAAKQPAALAAFLL